MEEIYKRFRDTKYEISDRGNIKGKNGKVIKPFMRNRYKRIGLYIQGNKSNFSIHRLVWEVFNGEIPKEKDVNHKSVKRGDNRLVNLYLMDRAENLKNLSNTRKEMLKRKRMLKKEIKVSYDAGISRRDF